MVEEAIQKADTLVEALGWIRQFRDKIVVIKLGGSVMEDMNALRHVLVDVVFMSAVGMRPVVVHGGGAAISRAMDAAGISLASVKALYKKAIEQQEEIERLRARIEEIDEQREKIDELEALIRELRELIRSSNRAGDGR